MEAIFGYHPNGHKLKKESRPSANNVLQYTLTVLHHISTLLAFVMKLSQAPCFGGAAVQHPELGAPLRSTLLGPLP